MSHLLWIITNAKRQIILDQARPLSARTENFLTDVKTGRNMDTATQTRRACIYTVLRPVVDAVSKTLLCENSQSTSSLNEAPKGLDLEKVVSYYYDNVNPITKETHWYQCMILLLGKLLMVFVRSLCDGNKKKCCLKTK